jgi:hypothetical protein
VNLNLKLLTCWTDDDFIHINITGLFNGVGVASLKENRLGNRICINGYEILGAVLSKLSIMQPYQLACS